MVNRYRGETALMVEGRALPMRLTLGALAEIEAALPKGAPETAADLLAVLAALLRGGGERAAARDVERLKVEPAAAARAIAEAFAAAAGGAA